MSNNLNNTRDTNSASVTIQAKSNFHSNQRPDQQKQDLNRTGREMPKTAWNPNAKSAWEKNKEQPGERHS